MGSRSRNWLKVAGGIDVAFVLDASAALPWCFVDEATVASDDLLARAIARERIYVPSHWPMEILSAVTRAARRGRLDDSSVNAFLEAVPSYDIVVDQRPLGISWREVRPLITAHRLSAYDAAYLALAKRVGIPLATFDRQLQLAATSEGVALEV